MPEIPVKEQIRKLVALQTIDKELYDLKVDSEEKPAQIDALRREYDQAKAIVAQIEEKKKKALVARKEFELELKEKEDAIAKANGKLSQLKTNKEYHAMMTEIESMKADKSRIEEKILISYDEVEAIEKEIAKETVTAAQKEARFNTDKKSVEEELGKIKSRIAELTAQRSGMTEGIEASFLNRYERLLANKEGLAIVPVKGMSCGGCYMNVTPQTINAVKMAEEFIFCEICARFLYFSEGE